MRRIAIVLLTIYLAGCGEPARESEAGPHAGRHEVGSVTSFDGVPIAYTVAGKGDGALLFIHGWSCDRDYWTAQVDAFAAEQKVVTVDLAGHGDSGSTREEWTVPALAADVEAVITGLDLGSVVLVGHSLGGAVALEVARRMPERVVGVIGVDTFQDVRPLDPAAWGEIVAGLREDFPRSCGTFVERLFLADADPELVREITSDMCSAPPDIAVELLSRLPEYDAAAAFSAVSVPVRAINGALEPTRIEENRALNPGFDVLFLEGTGHFPMLERPDEFNRLLDRVVEELTAGGQDLAS